MEPLRIVAIGSWIVGLSMAALSIVAMIRSIRDVADRLTALGVAYLGMFLMVVGFAIYLLALMSDSRLPLLAGIPAFALVGFTAIRLRMGASRAFAEAKRVRSG